MPYSKIPTAEEILEIIRGMHPTKAPGPDGIHALFFQIFWHIVGHDVVNFICEWWGGRLSLNVVNHTNIVLIPRVKTLRKVSDFRPISLCNVLYKIVSKLLANRLKPLLNDILSENQSAFTPGRLITDNALIAFEIFHAMKLNKTKKGTIAFKMDMSKAYDRIEWSFLSRVLIKMGFHESWVQKVMSCLSTASYSVLINGHPYGNISPTRGLR